MSTSLILIEGVLRKQMGQPIPEGLRLYRALLSVGRVILLSTAATQADRESTSDWLELNGCTGHDSVAWGDDGPRVPLVNMYRREGYDVAVVVEPDPGTAMELISAGFNVLLFVHAMYTRPDWRPDSAKGIQPWENIVNEVAEQAKLKAKDARLRNED